MASLAKGVKDTWGKLGPAARVVIALSVVAVFLVTAVWLALSARGGAMEVLWSNLDPRDAADIVTELERQSVRYELSDGGATIKAPADQLYRIRLSLASLGLPSSGVVGFESISGNSLWASDFEKKVQYTRALAGELTRTVKAISGVEDARVHIVLPEDGVFLSRQSPATASILLKLKPLWEPNPATVRGIMNLVACSVQGLSPDDVTVMDTTGRLLSQSYGSDGVGQAGSAALDLVGRVERDLEARLVSMLSPVLGPGNVVCQVSAVLDMNEVHIVDDVWENSEEGVLRSVQEVRESYEGTGAEVGGVAGGLDIPTYGTGTSGETRYQRSDTTTNYEIPRKTTETIIAPGTVKKLSVALVVNKALDEDEEEVIGELVSAALGLDSARQDHVSVVGIPFDTSIADQFTDTYDISPVTPRSQYLVWAAVLAGVLLLSLLAWFLVRAAGRKAPEPEVVTAPAFLLDEDEPIMQPGFTPTYKQKDDVEKIARSNPAAMATLLKTWLLEDER